MGFGININYMDSDLNIVPIPGFDQHLLLTLLSSDSTVFTLLYSVIVIYLNLTENLFLCMGEMNLAKVLLILPPRLLGE